MKMEPTKYQYRAPKASISVPFRRNFQLRTRSLVTARLGVSASHSDVILENKPWLIVGLGNPGNNYHGTRHNIGFEMIDRISQEEGIKLNTIQSKALLGIGAIGEVPLLLAKSQAYMNYSGESVGPLAAYYQVPLRQILLKIFHDRGYSIKALPSVKSVVDHLNGCHVFPRLCIGIGNSPGTMEMKAFLLQKFSSEERKQVDIALEQGVEAVRNLVLRGLDNGITKFNMGQKYKYHKV